MKKYTITLDEKQMEFIKVTMDSQVEISNDVAWFAYDEYRDHETDGNWREFEQGCADYYMAKTISNILNSAEGHDSTEGVIPGGDDMDRATHGDVISSNEFAREIDDYISDEIQGCMEAIAGDLYQRGYMKEEPHYGDFDDNSCCVRDDLVSFLQDVYGLVKSDGKPF